MRGCGWLSQGQEWKAKLADGQDCIKLCLTFGRPYFVSKIRVYSHAPEPSYSSDYSLVVLPADKYVPPQPRARLFACRTSDMRVLQI